MKNPSILKVWMRARLMVKTWEEHSWERGTEWLEPRAVMVINIGGEPWEARGQILLV